MKVMTWTVIALAAVTMAMNGCSKKGNVDTAPLEKSFASAEPANKAGADKAVSEIKAGDYSAAMASLQKLATQAKLTPEQQQAIKDVLAQVQKELTDAVAKTAT